MDQKSEMERLLRRAADSQPERRRRRRRRWLNEGEPLVQASYVADLTDSMLSSIGDVHREIDIEDAMVEALSVRLRPGVRASYRFRDRYARGNRCRTLGLVGDQTVNDARIAALRAILSQREDGQIFSAEPKSPYTSVADCWLEYARRRHPDRDRPFHNTVKGFLAELGDRRVSSLKRHELKALIKRSEVQDARRAYELHKRLRAFFSWCVEAGVLQGNPLSNTKMPVLFQDRERRLNLLELGALYRASRTLDDPWRGLTGFILLTGATADEARNLRRGDVDLDNGIWHRRSGEPISLNCLCVGLLRNCKPTGTYFFQTSRGSASDRAAHLHPLVRNRLRAQSGVLGWTWPSLTRSIRLAPRSYSPSDLYSPITWADDAEGWAEALEWASQSDEERSGDAIEL